MTYDPSRKVFVHRMPPVTREAIGARERSIRLSVTATNPAAGPNPAQPVSAYIFIAGYCTHIGN